MLVNSDQRNERNIIFKRIIGIEILRMFLCFRIVLLHYYSGKNKFINKIMSNFFQVPCFFFISFYFLYPIISKKKLIKMQFRLERLFIPYIAFAIIIWIFNNIIFFLIKYNRFNRYVTLKELKLQLIIGRGIQGVGQLWFHFNLLINIF